MAGRLRVPSVVAGAALAALAAASACTSGSADRVGAQARLTAPVPAQPSPAPTTSTTATTVSETTAARPTSTPSTTSTTTTTSRTSTTSTTDRPAPITASTTAAVPAPPTTTSCTTVAHIGDSTSAGLFEPAYLPDATDALPAQYERVGVRAVYTEVSGGRSTVETIDGNANAFDTVVGLRRAGYRGGCWVLTIGTNDAANVAIGGVPDLATRIDKMMFVVGSDPVLWVDAVTRVADGPYADVNMRAWNEALEQAALRFPTLHVLRWSDVAIDEWFAGDGIHYTSAGAAWRSHVIADALVGAFPDES